MYFMAGALCEEAGRKKADIHCRHTVNPVIIMCNMKILL
jgi:hypothetical protein